MYTYNCEYSIENAEKKDFQFNSNIRMGKGNKTLSKMAQKRIEKREKMSICEKKWSLSLTYVLSEKNIFEYLKNIA